MRLGLVATKRQYLDHLLPIWDALEEPERGEVWTSEVEMDRVPDFPTAGRPTLWIASSSNDAHSAWRSLGARDLAFMDHGCGLQVYTRGALEKVNRARWILAPNDRMASWYASHLTGAQPIVVVGTPKMDALVGLEPVTDGRTLAISFHWTSMMRARVVPSVQFEPAIREVLRLGYHVLGHGHPHVWGPLSRYWESLGVEPVAEFAEVLRRADVYACDHSSTIYEFAATGRPVLLLDVPGQQHRVRLSSGLRYTWGQEVGEHATFKTLPAVVEDVFAHDARAEERAAITAELFPYLGSSAGLAAAVLRTLPVKGIRMPPRAHQLVAKGA